jgi:hypothetical protein
MAWHFMQSFFLARDNAASASTSAAIALVAIPRKDTTTMGPTNFKNVVGAAKIDVISVSFE